MLSTVVLGALALVPGVPLALVLGRGGTRRWSGVLVEALLLGTSWYLLLALVLTHVRHYGRWQVMVPTLALAAACSFVGRDEARRVRRPALTGFSGFMAVLTVLAMVLRSSPFYFIYEIGDFGEYVNRANSIAHGGLFTQWFTRGFSVALSLSNLALGAAHTVDLMPFLGIVLVLATVALAERLGASTWARMVVAVVMAVGVVPVWFSRFPASESLYALLQVGMVLFVVTAVQRGSHRLAATAGALCGLMLVVRGNGLMLGPIAVGLLLVGALTLRRRTVVVLATFTATSMASLAVAFIFNSRVSFAYFIEYQLPRYVPHVLYTQLQDMGGLRFAAPRVVALVVATCALVWLALWLNRTLGPNNDAIALRRIRALALPALVAVAAVVLVWPLHSGGLTDAMARYDVTVVLLGAIGLGVALWRFAGPSSDVERAGILLIVLAGVAFGVLFAVRIPAPRYAPYYLYWDRYLFSEVFPIMVLVSIWAVALAERGLRRLHAPVAIVGVAAVLLGALLFHDGSLTRQERFMGDAYGDLDDIADLTAQTARPIMFSGIPTAEVPPELYETNSYRVIALPLNETFNRVFLNIDLAPYAPDPTPSLEQIHTEVADSVVGSVYLMQVGAGDDVPRPLDGGDQLAVRRVGQASVDIPMLDRPVDGTPSRWRDAHFNVVVSIVAAR